MNAAANSIFAKIVAGQIPCQRVYEDVHVLAFLDINPLADGHTLVIPKRAVERIDELSGEEAAAIGRCLPELGKRITAATGAAGYNVLQNNGAAAGQEVPYVHFHIIPRRAGDELGFRWKPQKRTPAELAAMAERLRS